MEPNQTQETLRQTPPSQSDIVVQQSQFMSSSTTNRTTELLERSTKQIYIKDESTITKVSKSREIKHYNADGEELGSSEVANMSQPNTSLSQHDNQTTNDANSAPSTHNLHDAPIMAPVQQDSPIKQPLSNLGGKIAASATSDNNYQNLAAVQGFMSEHDQNSTNYPQTNSSSHHQPVVLPNTIQRTTNKTINLSTPSGYEELDSTMGYSKHHQGSNDMIDSVTRQPITTNTAMIMPHDNSNSVPYVTSNKSNYDIAYGTTGSFSQVPIISTSSGIYGTRADQPMTNEPIYAVRDAGGNVTYMTQQPHQIADQTGEIRWRDPKLEEVISFLRSPDALIRANSVAYLQHLSYNDDDIKQRTRILGGIPLLVDLLNRDILEVQRNVCGALRNLSYGKRNDDNKRAIRDAQGIQALVRTLVNNPDNEIRESATSVLWNLSSCEEVKYTIVEYALHSLVSIILVPYTAWFKENLASAQQFLPTASETHWSTVFRNATGVIRNISSAGPNVRKQLRECNGLVESLFFIINASIRRSDVENKLIENCVCTLRNLSYRCQETQDLDYDKHYYSNNNSRTDSTNTSNHNSPSSPISSGTSLVGQVSSRVSENLGCFSFARRSKSKSKSKSSFLSLRSNSASQSSNNNTNESQQSSQSRLIGETRAATLLPPHHSSNMQVNGPNSYSMIRTSTQLDGFSNLTLPASGLSNIANSTNESAQNNSSQSSGQDLLWQPDVVKPYLALLSGCSNSETLEAAAGAIQNLSACYWQPSVDIRAAVRKERGLPVLVELLRMDKDSVVCVVATALRNLAIDQKNKELIGKYAMPDLVNKLTSRNQADVQDAPSSDDTIAAVLATLHEVISNNADFVRSFYESGGLNKLNFIVRNRARYSVRVQRFAAQVLLDMWKFTELRDLYKKGGWKESHFVVRQPMTSKTSTYSVNSNTIERPISSQQADRSGSVRNLKAISNPIPKTPDQFQGVNTGPSGMGSINRVLGPQPVQMTLLNGVHSDQMDGPQVLYAQVDRQRKRVDPFQQQKHVNC